MLCLLFPVLAQFPFGEPAPPAKPPNMGGQIGEVLVVKEPPEVEDLIVSPIVSLMLFTDDEDSNEANWFMLFNIMVEKSINVAGGDARVQWAMVDASTLRQRKATHVVRSPGIWLFCDASDDRGVKLPMNVQSEQAVQQAGAFILSALAAAHAERIDGVWHKEPVKDEL